MKIRRLLYIIVAGLLILLNLAVDMFATIPPDKNAPDDAASRTGSFIGSQIFIVIGVMLLLLAYTVTRKIKRKEKKSLEQSIDKIGIH